MVTVITKRGWLAMRIAQLVLDRLGEDDDLIENADQDKLVAAITQVVNQELARYFGHRARSRRLAGIGEV